MQHPSEPLLPLIHKSKPRVLVIQLRQLGDILVTTPILRAIKENWQGAHVVFLSHSMGQDIIRDSPDVDEHWIYDDPAPTFLGDLRMWAKIFSGKFDVVFDFMNNPRSAMYTLASLAKVRAGFESSRRLAYNLTMPRVDSEEYIVLEKFRLLERLRLSIRSLALSLPWFGQDLSSLKQVESESTNFARSKFRVAIAATHRKEEQRWPYERYVEIADKLVAQWGAEVIWTWAPGEEPEVDKMIAMCRSKTHKSPPTTIRQLAAIFAHCDLFIGNSNGASHVAVAANIPSLQLHGPTSDISWCPLTTHHRAIKAVNMNNIDVAQCCAELEKLRPVAQQHGALRSGIGKRSDWLQESFLSLSCANQAALAESN